MEAEINHVCLTLQLYLNVQDSEFFYKIEGTDSISIYHGLKLESTSYLHFTVISGCSLIDTEYC